MPSYSFKFKENAVALLENLKQGPLKFPDKTIKNVRELCEYLDISSYSLYKWREKIVGKNVIKPVKMAIDKELLQGIYLQNDVNKQGEKRILNKTKQNKTIDLQQDQFYEKIIAGGIKTKQNKTIDLQQDHFYEKIIAGGISDLPGGIKLKIVYYFLTGYFTNSSIKDMKRKIREVIEKL
ncbi:MAG: hypothetical protein P8Y97_21245 [Candidatus Lokiarchaeota archaeon]